MRQALCWVFVAVDGTRRQHRGHVAVFWANWTTERLPPADATRANVRPRGRELTKRQPSGAAWTKIQEFWSWESTASTPQRSRFTCIASVTAGTSGKAASGPSPCAGWASRICICNALECDRDLRPPPPLRVHPHSPHRRRGHHTGPGRCVVALRGGSDRRSSHEGGHLTATAGRSLARVAALGDRPLALGYRTERLSPHAPRSSGRCPAITLGIWLAWQVGADARRTGLRGFCAP